MSQDAWSIYDTFDGGVIDSNLWSFVTPRLPGGGYARHDPNAQVSCSGRGVVVAIPEFSQSHGYQ